MTRVAATDLNHRAGQSKREAFFSRFVRWNRLALVGWVIFLVVLWHKADAIDINQHSRYLNKLYRKLSL
jgi:hypothetical protein